MVDVVNNDYGMNAFDMYHDDTFGALDNGVI